MMNSVSVIDADGHVLETDAELEQYFEGSYRGHKRSGVFSIFPSLDGWPRGFVRDLEKINRTGADNWIQFIEGSKIDAAVLYPTAGLSLGLIQDPDWACVVARTYNNWLHDRYCKVDPRLKGVALLPVHDLVNVYRLTDEDVDLVSHYRDRCRTDAGAASLLRRKEIIPLTEVDSSLLDKLQVCAIDCS